MGERPLKKDKTTVAEGRPVGMKRPGQQAQFTGPRTSTRPAQAAASGQRQVASASLDDATEAMSAQPFFVDQNSASGDSGILSSSTNLGIPSDPSRQSGVVPARLSAQGSNSAAESKDFETHRKASQNGLFAKHRSLGMLSVSETIDGWGGEIVSLISNTSSEAEVYLARKGGEEFAFKYYRTGISPKVEVVNKLITMRHPGLVQTYTMGLHKGSFYEVLQYAAGGAINRRNDDRFVYLPLSEERLKPLVARLNSGLKYLHDRGLIHRDIKPGNILVGDPTKHEYMFADFGISSLLDLESGATERMTTINRTEGYAAPEVYSGIIRREVDYYALGVTIYSLVTAKNPFINMNPRHIMCFTVQGRAAEELLRKPEAAGLSESTKRLISGLLVVKNEKRWGFDDIEKWLSGEEVAIYEGRNDSVIEFQFDGETLHDLGEVARACMSHSQDPRWQKVVRLGELSSWARGFDNVLAAQIKEIENHYGHIGKPDLALRNIAYLLDPEVSFRSAAGRTASTRKELFEILQAERIHYMSVIRDLNADMYLWLSARLRDQSLLDWCRSYLEKTKDDVEAFEGICCAVLGFEYLYLTSDLVIPNLRALRTQILSAEQKAAIKALIQNPQSRLYVWGKVLGNAAIDGDMLFFWNKYLGGGDVDKFLRFVTHFAIIQFGDWQFKGQTEFVDDRQIPEGVGLGLHADGRKYIGNWLSGSRHGKGTTEFPSGEKFTGIYNKDQEEGEGVLLARDGREIKGVFVSGKIQGAGSMKDRHGVYEGHFKDSQRHGFGVFRYKRGDVYQGEWFADARHGRGVMNYASGETYTGQWAKGEMDGYGQLLNPKKGWSYTGYFKDSRREGMGVQEALGGSWEQGIWKRNALFHGRRVKREDYQLSYSIETVNGGKSVHKLRVSGEKRPQWAIKLFLPALALMTVSYLVLVSAASMAPAIPVAGVLGILLCTIVFVFWPGLKMAIEGVRTLMGLSYDERGNRIMDWSSRRTLASRR